MMHGDEGYGAGWAIGMAVMMVVFWGTIVALVVVALRGGLHPTPTAAARPDARAILDERLARGEIDATDYRAARDALDQR